MKRGIVIVALITLLACSVSALTNITACGTVSTSDTHVLTGNIASAGTCLTVTASDLIIDCQGNTISYGSGGGDTVYGVTATLQDNITIRNCNITDTNAGGILNSAIFADDSTRLNITNNTLFADGTSNPRAVFLNADPQVQSDNSITYNTLISTGTGGEEYGMFLDGGVSDYVAHNTFDVSGTSGAVYCFLARDHNDSRIVNNTCSVDGTGGATSVRGFYIWSQTYNVSVVNNTVTMGTAAGTSHGILIPSGNAFNNTLTGNIINSTGSPSAYIGFTINFGIATTIANNIVDLSDGGTDTTIQLNGANDTYVANNVLSYEGLGRSLRILGGSTNSNFSSNSYVAPSDWFIITDSVNTTFSQESYSSASGSIQFDTISVSGNQTISSSDVSITNNSAFVNSTAIPILNTSARITFNNTGFFSHQALVDVNDNGTFVECDVPLCTEVSDSPGVFVFDVQHFTTFSSEEFVPPVPEFSTLALLASLIIIAGGFLYQRRRM